MSEIKTLTVDELIAQLTKFPHDTKVYMSIDPEGNGYGTIAEGSFEYNTLDKGIAIYPLQEHLDWDELFPKSWEKENRE